MKEKYVAFGRYAPKNESVCFFAARQKRIDVLGSPDLPPSDASCKMRSEAFKNGFKTTALVRAKRQKM
jgi:hypothetical protein